MAVQGRRELSAVAVQQLSPLTGTVRQAAFAQCQHWSVQQLSHVTVPTAAAPLTDTVRQAAFAVSALNCDVIAAANCLTATTRTVHAADHVTLRRWEGSYWRFETPRCVFLQGESFLDHPETSDTCCLTRPHILSDNYHWSLPSQFWLSDEWATLVS